MDCVRGSFFQRRMSLPYLNVGLSFFVLLASPVPAYRQNCQPAMTVCHLPLRPLVMAGLDLNRPSSLDGREANFVPIKAILDDPQHYNAHRVRVEGTIMKFTVLPNASGCGHFDGYVFLIEDETGWIEVLDVSTCDDGGGIFLPLLLWNPAGIGDRVSIAVSVVSPTIPPGIRPHAKLVWISRLPEKLP